MSTMTDPIARLNAALSGRYALESWCAKSPPMRSYASIWCS